MDASDSQVDVGGEFVVAPALLHAGRRRTARRAPAQKTTIASPVPTLGVIAPFYNEDRPSRVTFGAGIWNTFGGSVDYKKTGMPAIDSTEDPSFEANAGVAAARERPALVRRDLRLGLGLFALDATMNPFDAHLSASGVGVGAGDRRARASRPTTCGSASRGARRCGSRPTARHGDVHVDAGEREGASHADTGRSRRRWASAGARLRR